LVVDTWLRLTTLGSAVAEKPREAACMLLVHVLTQKNKRWLTPVLKMCMLF